MAISANLIKRTGEEIIYPNTVAENVSIGNDKTLNTFVSEMNTFKSSQDTLNTENVSWQTQTDQWKTSHTHTMSQITDLDLSDLTVGSADKVGHPITVKFNGGTTENDDQFTFDGSRNVTIDITSDSVGAAPYDHTHQASDITGLEEEIEAKIQTINPGSHRHAMTDIDGLSAEFSRVEGETYYTTNVPTTVALGGLPSGYVPPSGSISLSDLVYTLLHPYVSPRVTVSMSPSNGGTVEWNTTQSITGCAVNCTMGSNTLTKIEVYNGSSLIHTEETPSSGYNYITFDTPLEITKDSASRNLTVRLYDDTDAYVSATSGTYNFVYPYYYGTTFNVPTTTDIQYFTKKIVGKGNQAIVYNMSQTRAVFCCYKNNGAISTILDTNGFDATCTFTRIEMQIDGVDYYVYYNEPSTNSNFTFTFKY